MKCQPLALVLILVSVSHKAVKRKAAWSQVAGRASEEGALGQVSSPRGLAAQLSLPTSDHLGQRPDKEQVGALWEWRNGNESVLVAAGSEMSHRSALVGLRKSVEGEGCSERDETGGQWNCGVHADT